MAFKVVKKKIEFDPHLIRYFCDQCGFEKWDDKIIPMIKCDCDYFADHEEWEG